MSANTVTAVGSSYAVALENDITIAANSNFAGGASATFDGSSDKLSFTISILNPCLTTTVNAIVFSNAGSAGAYAKSIVDGTSDATITFVTPTDTATTTYAAVCGDYTYSIHSDNTGANFSYNAAWAVITGPATNTYTLTIDTTQDLTLIGTTPSQLINVWIRARMNTYSDREIYTKIEVTITEASCSCASLALANPSASVTVVSAIAATAATNSAQVLGIPAPNTIATNTDTALAKCYEVGGPGCSADGSVTSI